MYHPLKSSIFLVVLSLSFSLIFTPSIEAAGRWASWDQKVDYTRKDVKTHKEEGYWLGPIGVKVIMHGGDPTQKLQPQMRVNVIEKGSPADGKLQHKDVILGVNGQRFVGHSKPSKWPADRRVVVANAILEAEAGSGQLKLDVWQARTRRNTQVTINLEKLGALKPGAPFNDCPKTRKMIERGCDYIVKNRDFGFLNYGALALLATGDRKYHSIVKKYIASQAWSRPIPDIRSTLISGAKVTWDTAANAILLAEYELLTGDKTFHAAMRDNAIRIGMGQDRHGLWGHGFAWTSINGGELHGNLPGYGAVNNAGLPCFIALGLAKKAGVSHPEVDMALDKAAKYFRTYVYVGKIGYGFHPPTGGHGSNGKNSKAAVAYRIIGDYESMKYYAQCSISYRHREGGHTGNFFNNAWGGLGANTGGPEGAKSYYKTREWYRTLVRSWNGSFRYQHAHGSPQNSYSRCSSTGAYLLNLLTPRRAIYLTGKGMDPSTYLSKAELKECDMAFKGTSMTSLPTSELIRYAQSFSPELRPRAGKALIERMATKPSEEKEIMQALLRSLSSDDFKAKLGAASILSKLGTKAKSAGPLLTQALAKSNSPMASEAFARAIVAAEFYNKDTLKVLLEDAVRSYPDELTPLRLDAVLEAVRVITTGGTRRDVGSDPFQYLKRHQIDKDLYMKAMSYMIAAYTGQSIASLRYIRKYFTNDQIFELTDAMIDCASQNEWALDPLKLLAEKRVIEAFPRIWERIDVDTRDTLAIPLLSQYGSLAKDRLPRLRELAVTRGQKKSKHYKNLINQLQKARPVKTVSVHDYFLGKYRRLMAGKSGAQKINFLQDTMNQCQENAYIRKGALLDLIYQANKMAAYPIIIENLGSGDTHLESTAIRLGSKYPASKLRATLRSTKNNRQIAGLLLMRQSGRPVFSAAEAQRYLKHPSNIVRMAAVTTLKVNGGPRQIKDLILVLSQTQNNFFEVEVITRTIAAIRKRSKVSMQDVRFLESQLFQSIDAYQGSHEFITPKAMAEMLGLLAEPKHLGKTVETLKKRAEKAAPKHLRHGTVEMQCVASIWGGNKKK